MILSLLFLRYSLTLLLQPTPSITPSPVGRAPVFILSLTGGKPDLLIGDEGGMATLLREAVAQLAGLDPSRVAITFVAASTTSSNGTSSIATRVNATSPGNNNTSNSSFVYQTAPRSLAALSDSALCSSIRSSGINASATVSSSSSTLACIASVSIVLIHV